MSLTLVSTQREIALLKESQLTMPPIAEYVDQSREDLEKQVAASRADMLESETRMAEAIGQQEDKVNIAVHLTQGGTQAGQTFIGLVLRCIDAECCNQID